MSRWFRHYAGMMRDDKLVRAALRAKQPVERVVWIWGVILESAAEINDGGRFDIDPAEAAYFLRTDEADVVSIFSALEAGGRILGSSVVKWGDRQFQSDSSADRQKRYRNKQKSADNSDSGRDERELHRNSDGEVTASLRHGDAPETEIEAKTKKKEPSLRSGELALVEVHHETSDWPPDHRDQFWNAYPRKKAKKAAFKALDRIRRSGEVTFERLMAGVSKIPLGEPVFIPHPATWLNEGRWDDEDLPGEQNGPGRPRPLQDDSRSVSRALERQQESGITFGPRPRLVSDDSEGDLRLLPPRRGSGP